MPPPLLAGERRLSIEPDARPLGSCWPHTFPTEAFLKQSGRFLPPEIYPDSDQPRRIMVVAVMITASV
jgi:hypothetical protein